jgi:hypothetical protein
LQAKKERKAKIIRHADFPKTGRGPSAIQKPLGVRRTPIQKPQPQVAFIQPIRARLKLKIQPWTENEFSMQLRVVQP